ncbi:MAG: 4Fe-4S binding protein [Lachnospiraceae bacterium]|nr:4Fe-4S binding protein [Lachnospiraceae bacterium]
MATDISKITEKSSWKDITMGNQIYGAGTSKAFMTGEWRTQTPVLDESKCTQCLLCTPACPDSCIPVEDQKRKDFDLDHCKGCGICAEVCPFKAITMREGQ